MTTRLSVNLNKVALLRNQRDNGYPHFLNTAKLVLEAGAAGITVHPRPDERHVRKTDIADLSALVTDWGREVEFNIEGYPDEEFLTLVTTHKCDQVTLVPDAPDQKTSDHGWNIPARKDMLGDIIKRIQDNGARVSLFIDPEERMAEEAADIGADRIELYTGPYALDSKLLPLYVKAAEAANRRALGINAGHDLNLDNLARFIAAIPSCAEVSIGHAITADALLMGWRGAVNAYLTAIQYGQKSKAA